MATTAKVAALLLLVITLSVGRCFAHPSWRDGGVGDNRLGQASSGYMEPSSRDLDIGFTVGGDDDVTYPSGGPIRSDHVSKEGYRDQRLEDFNIGVFRERPVPMHASSGVAEGGRVEPGGGRGFYPWYASSGVVEGGWETPGGGRGVYPRYTSSGAAESGREEPGGRRVLYSNGDGIEYPGVISQPLDYKVGELKLRSDKGYQLSMHVPPSSLSDRPGVLKIDMKATLYRPIYY